VRRISRSLIALRFMVHKRDRASSWAAALGFQPSRRWVVTDAHFSSQRRCCGF
jgi:hypothetical protein